MHKKYNKEDFLQAILDHFRIIILDSYFLLISLNFYTFMSVVYESHGFFVSCYYRLFCNSYWKIFLRNWKKLKRWVQKMRLSSLCRRPCSSSWSGLTFCVEFIVVFLCFQIFFEIFRLLLSLQNHRFAYEYVESKLLVFFRLESSFPRSCLGSYSSRLLQDCQESYGFANC